MGRGYKESEEAYDPEGENREGVAEWEERLEGKEEIPDVEWAEDIMRIEDPKMRREEIEAAGEIVEKERNLEERRAAGETTGEAYLGERYIYLRGQKREATTRSFLKSRGRNVGNHLGRVFEGWNDIEDGSKQMGRKKNELWQVKNQLGKDVFERLLDRTVDGHELREEIDQDVLEEVKSGKKE